MLNLSMFVEQSAKENPERTAIICGPGTLTFSQLNSAINQVANGLTENGLGKGDHIALSCPNVPYFPIVYQAILRIGAVVVPLNVLLKPREIAYHLADSQAKAYFCFEGTAELPMANFGMQGFNRVNTCTHFWTLPAKPGSPSPFPGFETLEDLTQGQSPVFETVYTSPDDSAVILYTSGTTGSPKGAELSHSNMSLNAMVCMDILNLKPNDRHVVVLPLFHSFGQTVQMNAGLMKGNTLILIPRFQPEAVLDAIQNGGGTVLAAVPTMYWALLNMPSIETRFDLKIISNNLRLGVSGGAALPLELIQDIKNQLDIPVIEGYGLSETSPVATFNHLHKGLKPGTVGTPIWGCDVRIVNDQGALLPAGEIGEVAIKGCNVMKGYFNQPEATEKVFKKTAWFHSGDLGFLDEDGYLTIVDRLKDMIIRGGFNVYPREIEETLLTHPAVSLAAVIGIPDEEYGEEIKAFIVPKAGQNPTPEQISNWCMAEMAAYKYPRVIEIVESLPMTATGKVLKRELK